MYVLLDVVLVEKQELGWGAVKRTCRLERSNKELTTCRITCGIGMQ